MDFRGSSKKLFTSGLDGSGGVVRDLQCSTTPRNNLLDTASQIDKVCETTANSFPRQTSRTKCGGGEGGTSAGKCLEELQNIPPAPDEHIPFPPKRSSSLFTPGGASTLTLRHSKSPRECTSTLVNPKRISIATSSFWLDHPDMEKFANALDFGHETMKTQSVWGTSDQGSGGTECVDIWGDPPAVKKGVLMQQREKLWSRWKERYVILTRDYLNCFRRSANVHRSGVTLSEMGSFIFKLRLADVEEIRWENRRSGSLVALVLPQEPRILLRVPNDNTEALHQWYTLLQECIYMSKERRQALRNHHTSTYGKTYSTTKSRRDSCEGVNEDEDSPTKSQKSSSSPHSSSDEADGAGGMRTKHGEIDGRSTSASRRNLASRISVVSGKFSTTKSNASNAHVNGTSTGRRTSTRKYLPVVIGDHDDDDDDYDDDFVEKFEESLGSTKGHHGGSSTGGGTSSSDADDYAPVTLRRVSSRGGLFSAGSTTRSGGSNLTLNDFARNHPWKEFSTPEEEEDDAHREGSSLEEILPAQTGTSPSRRSSNGYAIPVDSLLRPNHQSTGNKRPESWSQGPSVGPQSNLFYRTPSIVPSHWVNKRELPLARSAGGPPFGRSTMIVCPSRLTAEVTYIRRM